MQDSYGRRIHYARISVTDLCNLRCKYCMPPEGVQKKAHEEILSIEQIEKIADSLAFLGFDKVRLTGGEPLVRKGILPLAEYLGSIQTFRTVALTTNAVNLPKYAKELKSYGVNSVNISIDSLNEAKYREITRGGELKDALKGLDAALEAEFDSVKVNAVLMRGFNDTEIDDYLRLSARYGIKTRFIELMPFICQKDFALERFISVDEALADIKPQLEHIGTVNNSTADYYKAQNGGIIGFIQPISNKFCSRCNRIRITSDGILLNCLHNSVGYDLKPYLEGGLTDYIASSIGRKPKEHNINVGTLQQRPMSDIGG